MPKFVSSVVTHRCYHRPALPFRDWHSFTTPVLILVEEISNLPRGYAVLYTISRYGTARSVEDETRNGHRNQKRNPNRNHETIVLGLFSHEN